LPLLPQLAAPTLRHRTRAPLAYADGHTEYLDFTLRVQASLAFFFFPRAISATPKNLTGPVVGRQLTVTTLDPTGPSTIAFASSFAFVLAVVLHRAVAKVNNSFFAVGARLNHFLFTRPCAGPGHVTGHRSFFAQRYKILNSD